jgi:hypothetical protein
VSEPNYSAWDISNPKITSKENRLLRVVFNADLRCSHDGLEKLAKSLKLDVAKLPVGQFVAFINARKTSIKLYAAGQTIAYFKMPRGQLNLKILSVIPKFFNGRELRYDDALKDVILKEMKR